MIIIHVGFHTILLSILIIQYTSIIIIIGVQIIIFTMANESYLFQTPSMRTRYCLYNPTALLPPIGAQWLWPVPCGSPLSINKSGGVTVSFRMLVRSFVVWYCFPSFLDTSTDWNSMVSSFCLRNHFIVLRNHFSSIMQSFFSDVSNFSLFSLN